jgi:O-antigen/teichoic acid export membrane protein
MDEDTKRKILKNTVAVVASRFGFLLIGFLLTPYILNKIGVEMFGLWVLILAVTSYFGVADLGFGTSFVKFVAEYNAKNEPEKINGVLTTGLLIYGALGVVILVVAWPVREPLLRLVGVSDRLLVDAPFVLGVTILVWVVGNLVRVYRSIIEGLQRMEVSSGIMLVVGLFYAVGTVVFLESGWGVRGLALNQLLGMAVEGVLTVYFARRIQPGLRLESRHIRDQWRPLFRFGLNLQVSRLAILVNSQFDKLLINAVIGTAQVTSYDLGARLSNVARAFPAMLLHALYPAASELDARQAADDIYHLFTRASKYVALVALFLLAGVAAMSGPVMQLWVGPGYEISAHVAAILALGALFNAVAGPVSPLVQGIGKPSVQRNAELLSLTLNVVLSVGLIVPFGLLGAAAGTACAMVLSSIYYLFVFHRLVGRSVREFFRTVLVKPAICALVAGLISYWVASSFDGYSGGGRLQALAVCALGGAVFCAIFVTLGIVNKAIDDDDLSMVRRLLGSVLRRKPG